MKNNISGKPNSASKALASMAVKSARNSTSSACNWFIYQPKEPANLAARLQAMKDGQENR